MVKKPLIEVKDGEIYAVPLFVSDESRLTRFAKKDLAVPNAEFAFMRVIHDFGMGQLLIEILDVVGDLDTPIETLLSANRLFRPIVTTSLGIYKKRWVRVGEHPNYDKERDSRFSEVGLVLSPHDQPRLWRGGTEQAIPPKDAANYESWTIWGANQVEKRILKELGRETDEGRPDRG